ncbi:hypothetical protein BZL41_05570 [Pseudomonas sp. PIC25]|uniref:hypothetical protein n=1 Tax=Pseudomonas sp. PIC25 TaxID=1958773 RepID=UPI000BAB6BF8|nr:hypothetical protein [Pseudomonas sp. PIC25]PAU65642.1 hypothetical protein BZL41_05570 [Pseudomonas sp. PIC25]
MQDELENLKEQVKSLLSDCLNQWLQSLSQDHPNDILARLSQMALQLSTAHTALHTASALCTPPTGDGSS